MRKLSPPFFFFLAAICLLLCPFSEAATPLEEALKFKGKTYNEIDCSNLVHKAFKAAGLNYPYTSTTAWPPAGYFKKVDEPRKGDVIFFEEHLGFYVGPDVFFGSQTSTGPAEAPYGQNKPYWGRTKKVLGYYRWNRDEL